jgi:hypothetical protein
LAPIAPHSAAVAMPSVARETNSGRLRRGFPDAIFLRRAVPPKCAA